MTNARNRKRRSAIDAIKNGITQLEFSFRPPSVGPLSPGGFGVEPKQIEKKCLRLYLCILLLWFSITLVWLVTYIPKAHVIT